MLLTNEQAEKRLRSPRNLANRFVNGNVTTIGIIKGSGPRIPDFMLDTMAILARTKADDQKSIASIADTSQQHVSRLNVGQAKAPNEDKVNRIVGQVKDLALDRLVASITRVTDDKLENSSAKDLSSIASNLSKVVSNVSPRSEASEGPKVNITIYAPEQRRESLYDTIEI